MSVTYVAIVPLKRQYPHEDAIDDWAAQASLRLLWDRVYALQEQLTAAEGTIRQLISQGNSQETLLNSVKVTADQAYALAQDPADSTFPPGAGPENCPDDGEAAVGVAARGPNGDLGVLPQTRYNAGLVIGGTYNEYPLLSAPAGSEALRESMMEELLLRMIWHLQQAGFTAGRQRNPSLAISKDKLTVQADGELWAYDVFLGVDYTAILPVQAVRVCPADYVADGGTPD